MRQRSVYFLFAILFLISFSLSTKAPDLAEAAEEPEIRIFQESRRTVKPVTFSPDGRQLFSAAEGIVRVWDLASGAQIRSFGKEGISSKVTFSPNGKYALIYGFSDLSLWDVDRGVRIRNLESPRNRISALTFSSNSGRIIMSAEGRDEDQYLLLYDVATGRQIKKIEGDGHLDWVNSIALSPDERYAVTGSVDLTVKLWDIEMGHTVRTLEGHSYSVDFVTFSPDGRSIISLAGNNFRIWDVITGEGNSFWPDFLTYNNRHFNIEDCIFSPEGRLLLLHDRSSLSFYDFLLKKEMARFYVGYTEIESFALSPDGGNIITGHKDGKIKLFDAEALKRYGAIENLINNRPQPYEDLDRFKQLDRPKKVEILLEMQKSVFIAEMYGFDDGEWLVMAPEGYFNISPNGRRHVKVSVGRDTFSLKHFFERFYNPTFIAQKLGWMDASLPEDIRKGVAPPPSVRIVYPKSGERFEKREISIVVDAKDMGGGIDEILLFHNESAVGGKTRGVTIIPKNNQIEKTYQIMLVPGKNVFRALGFSRDRTEGNAHEVVVFSEQPAEEIGLYVVVVGIDKYKNPALNLNFAVADASGLKSIFSKNWKGLFSKIDITEIYDKDGTKENIKRHLEELKATERDVVLIFFAGHGTTTRNEWYFISHDVIYPERESNLKEKGISSKDLVQMILNIRSLKKAVIIDSCKSGGLLDAITRNIENRKAITRLARSTGTHVIASSTNKQLVSELSQLGHGVFTYALLKGLKGEAAGLDGIVTVRELIVYIEQILPDISERYSHRPQYPVIDSRGQDFPLVVLK